MASGAHVVVIGGGLSGLSAAHTVLERGGNVVLLDKMSFMGGNSTKATSGINGAGTRIQAEKGVADSAYHFAKDTAVSAAKGDPSVPPTPLGLVLTGESAPAVHWLIDRFGLDLSLISQLGGHSYARTHRGKERFPGMTITYALMEKLEAIQEATEGGRVKIVTKARATELIKGPDGAVIGARYVQELKGAAPTHHEVMGPVVIATGGYAADYTPDSLLTKHAPQIKHLPTTNGEHCTGDGIKMAQAIGADTVDLDFVQVHPTGLVHPDEPDANVKFLAAEALRGVGGILLDNEGERFCDELGRRDYVTGEMWSRAKGPYRLVLNGKASKEIEWHCKHYMGRGIMKYMPTGEALCKEMGISVDKLADTFAKYNQDAAAGKPDQYGKKFFHNVPLDVKDHFHVAIVTPVLHYTMGGLTINPEAQVMSQNNPISGLFACGEVAGGVHGKNRLGGSSLLDCVVFGRVAGASAARALMESALVGGAVGGLAGNTTVDIRPDGSVTVSVGGAGAAAPTVAVGNAPVAAAAAAAAPAAAAPAAQPEAVGGASAEFTADDVAKHNKEDDCWVTLNSQVLDVTEFLDEHPGGKKAIMLFAGKDASEEFNMLHKPDVIPKYAAECVVGTIKGEADKIPEEQRVAEGAKASGAGGEGLTEYTLDDVSKHNTEDDCWVVLNNQVLNVTEFLVEHPGGKKAIQLFAGKDASEEFNMLHKLEVIPKFAPECVIGVLRGKTVPAQQQVATKAAASGEMEMPRAKL